MTEKSLVVIVVSMIFAIGFGNAIGGYAGDMVLEETRSFFEACETVDTDG